MSKIRRINFYGGPCSGKSTTAAWLFDQLKRIKNSDGKAFLEVDWVQEAAKQWTYLERPPSGWSDQHNLFNSELVNEDVALRKVDVVVCDAPLLMNCYYGWKYSRHGWQANVDVSLEFEMYYRSLNIFLTSDGIPYQPIGRFQTEQEAAAMRQEVYDFIFDYQRDMVSIPTTNRDEILQYVLNELKDSGYPPIASTKTDTQTGFIKHG